MKKKDLDSKELVSLNSELTEFNVQELEQRLETDPLAVGGLLDIITTDDSSLFAADSCEKCGGFISCNLKK